MVVIAGAVCGLAKVEFDRACNRFDATLRDTANKLTQRHDIRAIGRIQSDVRLRLDQPFDRKPIAVAARIDVNRSRICGHRACDGYFIDTCATVDIDHIGRRRHRAVYRHNIRASPRIDIDHGISGNVTGQRELVVIAGAVCGLAKVEFDRACNRFDATLRDTANKLTQRHNIRASGRIQSNVRLRLDQPFDRKLVALAAGNDVNRIGVRRHLAIDGKHVRTVATGQGNSGLGDHVAMKRKVVCLRACVAGSKVDGYRPSHGFQKVRTRPGVCDAKDDSVCTISRIQREVLTDNQWR